MLQTLRVQHLAIVENARVELAPGLNVVTGETGAGKSILAGALNLVLGGRADKSLIRSGETQCGVEAVFTLASPGELNTLLEEFGIDPCEDGQLLVRRIVSASGAGKNLVNGCAATVQMLKSVGDLLVDMHGPHDHQSLLNHDFQLRLLDAFAHLAHPLEAYKAAYRRLLDLESRLRVLEGDDQQVAQELDMLSFQIREIEEANVTAADGEDLEQEHARVANAQRILELADVIAQALTEEDASAFNAVVQTQSAISELIPLLPQAAEWKAEAESIAVQLQELSFSVNDTAQGIDADPQRLQWLEDRMGLLLRLRRKYGGSIPEVLAFLERARTRRDELERREERIAEVRTELTQVGKQVASTGQALTQARSKAATRLAEAVTRELRDLGFAHGTFGVSLQQRKPGPSGLDDLEFGFAPNVGEPMRPLRAIASSGEISRVMLATKVVLADVDRIPVLVFDEIDANVGGETANAVGEKLAAVAQSHQVLCITHLPQVAVHGGSHFVVAKQVDGGRTTTRISPLSRTGRPAEIARMLGGKDLTSVTMKHAREMLKKTAPTPQT